MQATVNLEKRGKVIHYPTLKTVLMVEDVLKNSDFLLSKAEIKRRLPSEIMHQTLNLILAYLEDSGKILITSKGVLWTYNPSKKLQKAIERGLEL